MRTPPSCRQAVSDRWMEDVRSGRFARVIRLEKDALGFKAGEEIVVGLRCDRPRKVVHFARNRLTGVESRSKWVRETIGPSGFIVDWNPFRAARPFPGNGMKPEGADSSGTHGCSFECQKAVTDLSLLHRPTLIEPLDLGNWLWALYPQLAPIETALHFILVPVRKTGRAIKIPHLPQVMTREFLEDLFRFADKNGDLMLFFNGKGAGASVDHFHVQGVPNHLELPLRKARIMGRGGHRVIEDYPASGAVFPVDEGASSAWSLLTRLQDRGIPFNIVFLDWRAYIFPRCAPSVVLGGRSRAIASFELAGHFIIPEERSEGEIRAEDLEEALRKVTLPMGDLLRR
jgi:hypothetical protein